MCEFVLRKSARGKKYHERLDHRDELMFDSGSDDESNITERKVGDIKK